ncbi:MAG: choice-of-anchor D domain-containing protein [Aeriscardovia sp.]|nr:choice-of-anchor D domain-containing protein [Aeriscardovia sp.]
MKSTLTKVLAALLLCFGVGARADNIVTIGTASGVPGDEVTLSIAMQNSDNIAALQLLIPLDEELSFVEGSAALTDRCGSHSVTAGVKDGELSLMVYSLGMTAITGTEGDVATLRLKLGNQPKNITLAASKLILTDSQGNSVSGTTQSGLVSIRCAKAQYSTTTIDFGRVPIRSTYQRTLTVRNVGNEPLEVSGLQFANYVTKFSSSTQFPFTVAAGGSANINITYAPEERGSISETVKVLCNSISKLNTITLTAEPFAVNELHVQPASGIADETVTVSLTMNNMDAISGFQFEFNLPDALEFVPNSFQLSGRKQNHAIVQSVTDGLLRIICYSPNDKPFTGEDGELATMQFVLRGRNSVTLKASKCLLTATINDQVTNVCSADYGATITIKSPRIYAASTLAMGATPVTQDAVKTLSVRNQGSAPLIISRVVFDKEDFYVQEQLPLAIEAGRTATLTVVYPSTEEGDYETTMQLYSNDPEQRVWNVKVTGNRFAPNYLSFSAADIYQGDPLAVEVSLSNFDAINGIQFDVEYPADYFEPTDELTTTARAAGLSVSQRIVSKGVARYFFYSLTDASIEPGEGKVLTMTFSSKGDAPEGNYQLKVTNVKLGTPDMVDKYAGKDVTCTFKVKKLLIGDINYDGLITIADVTALVNIILGKDNEEPYVYNHKAADVNGDKAISISDVTALVNKILGN